MINNYKTSRKTAGDTLVEVLLATVLLTVVLSGAYTLSNRATRINQQAFERTQITNFIQQQVELVRAARDDYNSQDPTNQPWDNIVGQAQANVPPLGSECDDLSLPSTRINQFHIETNQAVSPGVDTVNGLFRIWAEVERGTGDEYWDVHVYGCWEALGNNPTNVSAIVLRLEDPD